MIARVRRAVLSRIPTENRTAGAVAAVAVALVVAAGVWLLLDSDDEAAPAPTTNTAVTGGATTARTIAPALVSAAELRRLAAVAPVPVYWAGARPGTSLEVSRRADGAFFVRYLPGGRPAGDGRPALTVATYPRADGFGEIQGAADRPGADTFSLPGGGVAVYERSSPTNVHFAFPGQPYQVEVYSPSRDLARRLVAAGGVMRLG